MKPENEALAKSLLVVLQKAPATIEDLAWALRQTEDSTRYVVGQMVKRKQIVRLPERRYGHAERISATTPPPTF